MYQGQTHNHSQRACFFSLDFAVTATDETFTIVGPSLQWITCRIIVCQFLDGALWIRLGLVIQQEM